MNKENAMDAPELISKTHAQIAEEYHISVRTLYRWIKKTGLDIPRGLIDPYHLKIIYVTFGPAKTVKKTA